MDLSLPKLQSRLDDVVRWLEAREPRVHTLWFGTFDELWCDAQFRWVASSDCADEAHAFVCLWRHYLEQVEEFEVDASCLTFFFRSLTANSGYGSEAVFALCSAEEWHKETSLVTRGIVNAIKEVRSGKRLVGGQRVQISDRPYDVRDPGTYWGVFKDGQRVPEEAEYQRFVPGEWVEAIAIRYEWNYQELFARTTEAYVLFTWSTGA
ncbi:MAG TPA: hypothetical protein V6C57_27265 [Coleofasciculaceae cyanobacterium]